MDDSSPGTTIHTLSSPNHPSSVLKYHTDPTLLLEVEMRTTGANIHRVNQIRTVYNNLIDILNRSQPNEETTLIEGHLYHVEQLLQSFVATGILKRLPSHIDF